MAEEKERQEKLYCLEDVYDLTNDENEQETIYLIQKLQEEHEKLKRENQRMFDLNETIKKNNEQLRLKNDALERRVKYWRKKNSDLAQEILAKYDIPLEQQVELMKFLSV